MIILKIGKAIFGCAEFSQWIFCSHDEVLLDRRRTAMFVVCRTYLGTESLKKVFNINKWMRSIDSFRRRLITTSSGKLLSKMTTSSVTVFNLITLKSLQVSHKVATSDH